MSENTDFLFCTGVYVEPDLPGSSAAIHFKFEDQAGEKHQAAFVVKNIYLETLGKNISRMQPIRPPAPVMPGVHLVEERERIPAGQRKAGGQDGVVAEGTGLAGTAAGCAGSGEDPEVDTVGAGLSGEPVEPLPPVRNAELISFKEWARTTEISDKIID